MIINKDNSHVLNTKEVYIHDDELIEMKWNREQQTVCLMMTKHENLHHSKDYYINFENVLGFSSTSCDYWGASEAVNTIYLEENEQTLTSFLMKKGECQIDFDNYFETVIQFISGDDLRIVCKKIDICI